MKKNQLLKVAVLSVAAMVCVSGQAPRKEVQPVPETVSTNEVQIEKEAAAVKKADPAKRKSAAKRSMESVWNTKVNQKSAAKRSME